VYKPGNVKLQPGLLAKHQKYVKEKIGSKEDKPVFLVFHGGSGSTKAEYKEAISYGVVKVNVDTDTQWGYLIGIRDFVLSKKDVSLFSGRRIDLESLIKVILKNLRQKLIPPLVPQGPSWKSGRRRQAEQEVL